jgi:glycosyltransferase involved in cell wall biosynthesis
MRKKPTISVIIITKDRPRQLLDCIRALQQETYHNFNLVIVDQGKIPQPQLGRQRSSITNRTVYIHSKIPGKSHGLNLALNACHSDILAFIDDDCIPTKKWLQTIDRTFAAHPHLGGIFGQTLPFQPHRHKNLFCPSVHISKRAHLLKTPQLHSKNIGLGNNVAYRRWIFKALGGFKTWLGPGSVGSNGEDAEMALRLLIHNIQIRYEPNARVYHNRWLTYIQYQRQILSYLCGEVACYGYFGLQGHQFARNIINRNITDTTSDIYKFLREGVKLKRYALTVGYWCFWKIVYRLRGAAVACWYANPIRIFAYHIRRME